MKLPQTIIAATEEIFSTMVDMEIESMPALDEHVTTFRESVSGMVGLAGSCRGLLAINVPNPVAKAVTGNFLGLEVEEIDEDVKDAIGELANMVAGGIKAALSDGGKDIKMSIPSTVSGEEYSMEYSNDGEGVTVPFNCSAGRFLISLQLQRDL
ncbi:chemotaxis protein CheX [Desulfuromonas sp.]|uniref:chemotaxis protein CheX n=1 Tax=Desulfuromonas sp. TaxID=892 RepID=UPI0025BF0235|nr:chemotaxis protein CheX [Desulfuromonas sp.]